MIISSLIFFAANFVILLILIPIGAKIVKFSKGLSIILMLILGALCPYLLGLLFQSIMELFDYKWYHFVGLALIIGAMNNANIRGDASKEAQFASTFLFGSFVIMTILMFWIF